MSASSQRIGIVIVNLGTPDSPDASALRRYLREFLGDPRVVEAPRWLWWLVLNGIILRTRPAKSARNYKRIWTSSGSPLLTYTQNIVNQLQSRFCENGIDRVAVACAMRYGRPALHEVLNDLNQKKLSRILILPLFPQYSATTTGSIYDRVGETFKQWRYLPHLRMIGDYHDQPAYIDAIANSIEKRWSLKGTPERLLFSFHGIPQRYGDAGDPYEGQCRMTAQRVARRMGLPDHQWLVSFQSRFGKEPWLQPYTDETLRTWALQGIKSVSAVCPGFAVDCLETVEEIAVENAEIFFHHGGQDFDYVPALNDSDDHVQMLETLITTVAKDWLD